MTRCPAIVDENTEVVIIQTDAKTFADMFQYPICNLCAVSLLYFTICQRLTKFMTSTSLSAIKGVNQAFARLTPFFTPSNEELGVLCII